MRQIEMCVPTVLALAMAIPCFAAGQQAKPDANKVEATGCVEAGVETGCLILRDIKSGKLYNLIVKVPHPRVGEGIEFSGTLFRGMTACMQGTPVEVEKWEPRATLKCGAGQSK
jgi:hypothetical protein